MSDCFFAGEDTEAFCEGMRESDRITQHDVEAIDQVWVSIMIPVNKGPGGNLLVIPIHRRRDQRLPPAAPQRRCDDYRYLSMVDRPTERTGSECKEATSE